MVRRAFGPARDAVILCNCLQNRWLQPGIVFYGNQDFACIVLIEKDDGGRSEEIGVVLGSFLKLLPFFVV